MLQYAKNCPDNKKLQKINCNMLIANILNIAPDYRDFSIGNTLCLKQGVNIKLMGPLNGDGGTVTPVCFAG